MNLLSDEYVAGWFDGEGSIVIVRRTPRAATGNPRHELRVAITHTHLSTLEALRETYGGWVGRKTRSPKERRQQYYFYMTSPQTRRFLERIRPHVREKAPQVWLALEFLEQRTKVPPAPGVGLDAEEIALREGYRLALQNAKHLGYELHEEVPSL